MATEKGGNPFSDYQQNRVKKNTEKIKKAIDDIKSTKGKISFSSVAKLTGMTISGIMRNRDYVMLIEAARAQGNQHIASITSSGNALPSTLNDAVSMLRICKAENQGLRNKIKTQDRIFKRFNISVAASGDLVLLPVGKAQEQLDNDKLEAMTKIVEAVLGDRVYRIETRGLVNAMGELMAPRSLLYKAGILQREESS